MPRQDDPLPLFSAPDGGAVVRISHQGPEAFAYRVGFRQGAQGQRRSVRYDDDDVIEQYYRDGHRIGSLFRPLPCMANLPPKARG